MPWEVMNSLIKIVAVKRAIVTGGVVSEVIEYTIATADSYSPDALLKDINFLVCLVVVFAASLPSLTVSVGE